MHAFPHQTGNDEKRSVHDSFKVRGQTHAGTGELRREKANHKSEKKQQRPLLHQESAAIKAYRHGVHVVDLRRATFLARVLNLTPFFCTTVMVVWPVLLTLMSRTVPDLPV